TSTAQTTSRLTFSTTTLAGYKNESIGSVLKYSGKKSLVPSGSKQEESSNHTGVAILLIFLIVITSGISWLIYAYTNPQTPSVSSSEMEVARRSCQRPVYRIFRSYEVQWLLAEKRNNLLSNYLETILRKDHCHIVKFSTLVGWGIICFLKLPWQPKIVVCKSDSDKADKLVGKAGSEMVLIFGDDLEFPLDVGANVF
uniref:Uncharacterized protein n=1 Tax=Romanomermis culicivorax TaxID=13658 RepID=A0A915K8G9_ROMCU